MTTSLCPARQAEFLLGKRHYSDDLFELAAEHIELAVKEYFTADQECRVLCEGSYNYDGYNYMEYSADLFQSITGKAGCLQTFSEFLTEPEEHGHLLPPQTTTCRC